MLKILFKKQMAELNAWFYQDRKTGKRRTLAGKIMYAVLYALICISCGGIFFAVSGILCMPLTAEGLGWLYFAIMGLLAVALGVFGSVFNTYASLYLAKDNELLLSLPILPSRILASRLSGVWFWGFAYELLVMLPALAAYWLTEGCSVELVLCGVWILVLLSLFVLTLSCVLGWGVAKISARLKHKSISTVIASLIFIIGYYCVYFRAYEMLQILLANAREIGNGIRGWGYPLYLLGRAAEGSIFSMLLLTVLIGSLFAAVWAVLSRSFLNMATAGRSIVKKRYRETAAVCRSTDSALLFKEKGRFLSSAVYMLNCGLGTLILLVCGVVMLVKGARIDGILAAFDEIEGAAVLIFCGGICMLSAMNDITAPSVSLEGKQIWLVHSLPVTARQVLWAKLRLHLIATEPPVFFLSVCAAAVLRPGILEGALLLLVPALFVLLSAAFGLVVNLKLPNLTWTNEAVPVKQSIGVMLVMFGGWGFVLAAGALYLAVGKSLGTAGYLLLCAAVTGGLSLLLLRWLKTKGAAIFETL